MPHGISGIEGQKVAVALRPEKVKISKTELNGIKNTVTGTIDEVAYMGNSSVYQVTLDTGKRVRVSQSNMSRWSDDALASNDKVYLGWADHDCVVVTS